MGLFDYPTGPRGPAADVASLGFTFLEGVGPQAWKRLLTHAETVNFTGGQVLVRAGEVDEAFYIVTTGVVDVVVADGSTVLTTIPEGSVFGEISFFDGQPRSASIRARTDGRALRMTRNGFDQLSGWDPVLGRRILMDLGRILAMRLRWTTELTQH